MATKVKKKTNVLIFSLSSSRFNETQSTFHLQVAGNVSAIPPCTTAIYSKLVNDNHIAIYVQSYRQNKLVTFTVRGVHTVADLSSCPQAVSN